MTGRRRTALCAALALVTTLPACSSGNTDAHAAPTSSEQTAETAPTIPAGMKLVTSASGAFSLLLPANGQDATLRQGKSAEELTVAGRTPDWALQVTSQDPVADPSALTTQHCDVTVQDEGGAVATGVKARFGGEDAVGCRVTAGSQRTTWHLATTHAGRTYLVTLSIPQASAMAKAMAEPSLRSWTWHQS